MRCATVVVLCAFALSSAGCRQILGIDDLSDDGSDGVDAPDEPPDAAEVADAAEGDGPPQPIDADPPDASPPDAGFDPASCPASYSAIAFGSSRYRLVNTPRSLTQHHDDCKDDLPGATHLVAFESMAEANAVTGLIAGSDNLWVGTVQPPGQSTVGGGWLQITGEPTPSAVWGSGQPNDDDGNENGVQNVAVINASGGGLNDSETTFAFDAICECDGRPIDPTAEMLLLDEDD
jgi:hypothetical protein